MSVNLPTFASTEQLMETGALTGLVSRYHSIGQFTAYKAEQILVNKVPAVEDSRRDASRASRCRCAWMWPSS